MDTDKLVRWPTLVGAALFLTAAVGIDLTSDRNVNLVQALLALSATCVGAFLYAEGARHREWWQTQREALAARGGRRVDDPPLSTSGDAVGDDPPTAPVD